MRALAPAAFLLAVVAVSACRAERDGLALAHYAAEPVQAATVSDHATASSTSGTPVTLRRLSTSSYADFYASSISPDGRYMSMVDWSTYNLAVRDLSTGEIHQLTDVHTAEGEPWQAAGVSVFSRDGRHLVYGWEFDSRLQLRTIDFEPDADGVPHAGAPKVLFDNAAFTPYYPLDWSADGTTVLAKVYTPDNSNQLMLISAADGSHRTLRSFDWREPTRASFSPDGRFVAYDFPPEVDSSDRDLYVVSVDGTREATVVDGPGSDRLLGWQRNGSILFSSDRGGTPGIWRIAMSDGRPAAKAEQVRADVWKVQPLGFAEDGFYYGLEVNPPRLYSAAIDFTSGRMRGSTVAIEDPDALSVAGWDWSKGGKFLAYSASTRGSRGSTIGIRSDAGEVVKSMHLDLGATERVRWAPDGRSVILFASDDKGRRGFHRVDLEAGSYTTILRNDELEAPTPRGDFDISADGRMLWFATRADDGTWALVAYDIATGRIDSVTPRAWRVRGSAMRALDGMVAVSPDGSELALIAPDTMTADRWIGTMPIAGGAFHALARIERGPGLRGLDWTADGKAVVFSTVSLQAGSEAFQSRTWIAPVDRAAPRKLQLPEHTIPRSMRVHPDGRRITFLAGESRGEVWVMEGLGQRITARTQGRSQ